MSIHKGYSCYRSIRGKHSAPVKNLYNEYETKLTPYFQISTKSHTSLSMVMISSGGVRSGFNYKSRIEDILMAIRRVVVKK